MRKFGDLVKQGYVGQDSDLETSLFEYGLIWKEDEKELTFIFGVDAREDDHEVLYCAFDWGTIQKDVNPKEEWDWADWDAVIKYVGMDEEEFFTMPLERIVQDLMSYYGYENVFGSAYYPFKVEMED